MNIHSEIDETLQRLGNAEPPSGLARRIDLALRAPRRGFFLSVPQAFAACAIAASVAVFAVVFQPALRHLVLPQHTSAQTVPLVEAPRVAPLTGGFGTASAVHVPVAPVPVEPTPVIHGRGRSRSGRTELPSASPSPLPRGVAAPTSLPDR